MVFHQTACADGKTKVRLVAWRPGRSPDELIVGARAIGRFTNTCDRVENLQLFSLDEFPCEVASTLPGFVVRDEQRGNFIVYHEGVPPEPFSLPGSHEPCRKFVRVAGLPFAVAADAVIVGAALAAACGAAGGGGLSVY